MASRAQFDAQVHQVLQDPLAEAGVDLEEIEVRTSGRRRLVRVSVDTAEGISLDGVAAVTQIVSAALDSSDVMGDQPYVLEVGSPGVARPLTLPRHWRRNEGRLVRIVPTGGGAAVIGRIGLVTGADDDPGHATVTVAESGDSGARNVDFLLSDIERAVVQVEMRRSDRGH